MSILFIVLLSLLGFGLVFRFCRTINSSASSTVAKYVFAGVSMFVIFVALYVVFALLGPTLELFHDISIFNFLLSAKWDPFGSESSFGILPLLSGTLLVTVVSISVAVPIAVLSALFVTQLMHNKCGGLLRYLFEIPASVPSVVYGYFGVLKIAPLVIAIASFFGLESSYENAITAGVTIAIMIAPVIFYMTCDLIASVPKSLQYAVLTMGTTRTEFVFGAILPYISAGILGAVFLAIARVIGETMIVVLVVGLNANLTINPLREVTTVTAQIVSLLSSDTNAQSSQIMAAYALGLALFLVTFALSMGALYLDSRSRKQHKLLYS